MQTYNDTFVRPLCCGSFTEIRAENVTGLGRILRVPASTLTALSREAFGDLAHLLRPSHLQQLRNILDDKDSSVNDRAVALELLKNACIAAGRLETARGTEIMH